jgi:hypothetical protein
LTLSPNRFRLIRKLASLIGFGPILFFPFKSNRLNGTKHTAASDFCLASGTAAAYPD